MRFAHTVYPGKYNELAARKNDGTIYFNQFGTTSCPEAIRPEIYRKVEAKLKEYPHETYFLDVYAANGLFECYSDEHRLTREQFTQEVIKNHQILEDKYNQYLGGEWGSEYLNAHVAYVHGMMTLQRTWWGPGIEKKGTIYYTGDWRSNPRPTQMVGTRVANDKYLKYSINEYTRIPLYELVYHDAVVTSWRWEDGIITLPKSGGRRIYSTCCTVLLHSGISTANAGRNTNTHLSTATIKYARGCSRLKPTNWFRTGLFPKIIKFRNLFFLQGILFWSILDLRNIILKVTSFNPKDFYFDKIPQAIKIQILT